MSAGLLAILFLVSGLLIGSLAFVTNNSLYQSIAIEGGASFFSIFLGIVAVNLVLNSRERRNAAGPLLQLVVESVSQQHNDLFIDLGRNTFGTQKFNNLVDAYQNNKRDPHVFSPADLDAIFTMIQTRREDLVKIYSEIETDSRDIAFILGWAYDPNILMGIVSARADIKKFIRLSGDRNPTQDTKREIVEAYLDIDAATGHWVNRLAKKLGKSIVDGNQ
jgi:hypothetical protein